MQLISFKGTSKSYIDINILSYHQKLQNNHVGHSAYVWVVDVGYLWFVLGIRVFLWLFVYYKRFDR